MNSDASVIWGELQRVCKDIHQYFIEIVGVYISIEFSDSMRKTQVYFPRMNCVLKRKANLPYEGYDFHFAKTQGHLALVNFADIHQLINKPHNAFGIFVHCEVCPLSLPVFVFEQKLF